MSFPVLPPDYTTPYTPNATAWRSANRTMPGQVSPATSEVVPTHQHFTILQGQEQLPRWAQITLAATAGLGVVAAAATTHGFIHLRDATRRLSATTEHDIQLMQAHLRQTTEGKALSINWRDLPESFKALKATKINFSAELFDEYGIPHPKALTKMVSDWVPFIATLYNGYPAKTKRELAGYLLSPGFWFKDLGSKDGMWLKKAVTILGTPAKKLTQMVAEVVGQYPEARFDATVQGLKKQSGILLQDVFRLKQSEPGNRLVKLRQSLTLKLLANMAKPLRQGVLDIQSNAPSLPLGTLIKQVTPYMKEHYPALSLSKAKWKVINVASIGHILTHDDLPGSVFKLVRDIPEGTLLASARVMYGVITTLPEPILETWLKSKSVPGKENTFTELARALNKFGKSKEFNPIAYQLAIQMVNGFKEETNIAKEVRATTMFREHYHRPEELNILVPKILGHSVEHKVIEMERIKKPIGFDKLEKLDAPLALKRKAQALYGYILRSLDFSETHMFHADLHGGQLTYSQEQDAIGVLDHAAYLKLDKPARQRLAEVFLLAHRNAYYYDKGQRPPDKRTVLDSANKLATGIQGLRQDEGLVDAYRKPYNLTFMGGLGIMKELKGEQVTNWNAINSAVKARSLVRNITSKARDLKALTPEERRPYAFMHVDELKRNVADAVNVMLQQLPPGSTFTAKDIKAIQASLYNEFVSMFGFYVEGAPNTSPNIPV